MHTHDLLSYDSVDFMVQNVHAQIYERNLLLRKWTVLRSVYVEMFINRILHKRHYLFIVYKLQTNKLP